MLNVRHGLQYTSVIRVRHLPYGITQCYQPPDTSDGRPGLTPAIKLVLDLPTPEGWKAELT